MGFGGNFRGVFPLTLHIDSNTPLVKEYCENILDLKDWLIPDIVEKDFNSKGYISNKRSIELIIT